jgi:predicted amidohydrolase YtcJ
VRPRYRDAHTHLAAGAADLCDLDLRGPASAGDVLRRVRMAVRDRAPGSWVRGWGWSGHVEYAPALDEAAPDHPVFLARRDGHAAWINRAAGRALSVGTDAGVVEEETFDRARRRLPALTHNERAKALTAQLHAFAAAGIATIDDFVEPWAPHVYAGIAADGDLALHIGMWLPESMDPADAAALRAAFPAEATPIAVRGVKIFLDGTLGARTAALSSPYADDPGNSGALRIPEREIGDRVNRWASNGWPVALHAIGDRAVTLALDALEAAPEPAFGVHRIEHAQVVAHRDLARFRPARIVASVQPGHWLDDRPFLESRLGGRRDVVAHPLASLFRAGASLVFGSDWPVSGFDPEAILATAVLPARGHEALARADAVSCYTPRPR